jgi:DNA-binding MarR family transcriptional regulator
MSQPDESQTDSLVEALAIRLRRVDLVAWQRIAAWAERSDLSFAHLRVLLALTASEGPIAVSDLAEPTGLGPDAVRRAVHNLWDRRYLREDGHRFALTASGRDLVGSLEAAHRAGIEAYVDDLDPDERRVLEAAFGTAR